MRVVSRRLLASAYTRCRRRYRARRASASACDGHLLWRSVAHSLLRATDSIVCGVPPEYCEYGGKETYEKCKEWQLKHCPELVPKLKEQAEKAEAERKAKAEAAAAAAKAEGKEPEPEAPAAAAKPKKKKKVCG